MTLHREVKEDIQKWRVLGFSHKDAIRETAKRYRRGKLPANYPVPAIPIYVGWYPIGIGLCEGLSYWYIASRHMLWTCWQRYGLVRQSASSNSPR